MNRDKGHHFHPLVRERAPEPEPEPVRPHRRRRRSVTTAKVPVFATISRPTAVENRHRADRGRRR